MVCKISIFLTSNSSNTATVKEQRKRKDKYVKNAGKKILFLQLLRSMLLSINSDADYNKGFIINYLFASGITI